MSHIYISLLDTMTTRGLGESPSTGGYAILKAMSLMGRKVSVEDRCVTGQQIHDAATFAPSVFVGGDHATSYYAITGALQRRKYERLTLIVIDAHDDEGLGGTVDGGNWLRLLQDKHTVDVWRVGWRPLRKTGTVGVSLAQALDAATRTTGPVYLSIDMDGFDPAYAPGVNWPVPGGLAPNDVLHRLASFKRLLGPRLIGFDITEYVPAFDSGIVTASLAAHCLVALLDEECPGGPR